MAGVDVRSLGQFTIVQNEGNKAMNGAMGIDGLLRCPGSLSGLMYVSGKRKCTEHYSYQVCI